MLWTFFPERNGWFSCRQAHSVLGCATLLKTIPVLTRADPTGIIVWLLLRLLSKLVCTVICVGDFVIAARQRGMSLFTVREGTSWTVP